MPWFSKRATQQLQSRRLVPSLLDQDVENLALVIDGAPEPHLPTADPDEHLVQMPAARRWASATAEVLRDQRAELDHPASDRLAADFDSALGQQFLNIADAEREAKIQPHRLANNVRRKPMALE